MSALTSEAPAAILTPNALSSAALAYAERGFKVFPCKPRSKEPLTHNGWKAATTDAERIRQWWAKWPDANIGLATAGLLVVDVDGPDGAAALATHGDLPPAPTAHTGKGTHRFFADTAGTARNRTGVLPDVDIRAAGGYVIAAPSVHPSGAVYAWEPGLSPEDLPPPPAPQWLYDLAAPRNAIPPPGEAQPQPPPIPEGQRNATLTQVAGTLRADGTELAAITAHLLEVNAQRCKPPLPEGEVRRIAASVARYEPGASGPTVRVSRKLLRAGLPPGAVALYATRQALLQEQGAAPRQAALAAALGVGLRSVKQWGAELRSAGLAEYQRPIRNFVRVPVALLLDAELSHPAKVTALHLLACAVKDEEQVAAGQAALAKSTGRSVASVKRDLSELQERGHLLRQVAPFDAELGRRLRCNTYRVCAAAGTVAVASAGKKVQQVSYRQAAADQEVQQVSRDSRPLGRRGEGPLAVAVSPHAPQAHSDRPFPTKASHLRSAIVDSASPPPTLAARLQAAQAPSEPPPPTLPMTDTEVQAHTQQLAAALGWVKPELVNALAGIVRRHGPTVAAQAFGFRAA